MELNYSAGRYLIRIRNSSIRKHPYFLPLKNGSLNCTVGAPTLTCQILRVRRKRGWYVAWHNPICWNVMADKTKEYRKITRNHDTKHGEKSARSIPCPFRCRSLELGNSPSAEYLRQCVLTCLTAHSLKSPRHELATLVKCLRVSQNAQTHQLVLSLLNLSAKDYPVSELVCPFLSFRTCFVSSSTSRLQGLGKLSGLLWSTADCLSGFLVAESLYWVPIFLRKSSRISLSQTLLRGDLQNMFHQGL